MPRARRHAGRRRGVGARRARTSTSCATASTSASRRRTSACTRCRACRSCASRPRSGRASPTSRRASTTWISVRHRQYLDAAAPDAVHARGVVVLRARDRARRAGRAGRRARRRREIYRKRNAAHPARVHRPRLRVVQQHRPRVAHHLDAAAARRPDRGRALRRRSRQRGFIIYRAKGELADRHIQVVEHGRAARRDHRRVPGGGADGRRGPRARRAGRASTRSSPSRRRCARRCSAGTGVRR